MVESFVRGNVLGGGAVNTAQYVLQDPLETPTLEESVAVAPLPEPSNFTTRLQNLQMLESLKLLTPLVLQHIVPTCFAGGTVDFAVLNPPHPPTTEIPQTHLQAALLFSITHPLVLCNPQHDFFIFPVTSLPNLVRYYEMVTMPTDVATIVRRILQQFYCNIWQFLNDLFGIARNSAIFNGGDSHTTRNAVHVVLQVLTILDSVLLLRDDASGAVSLPALYLHTLARRPHRSITITLRPTIEAAFAVDLGATLLRKLTERLTVLRTLPS
uniref:Transcription initiation factor TFIID subunit 1 n=1 Tax=Lygus hesperus TaxID=30085 RepID=A0A0A9YMU0_LYGHE